ncbi:MAG: ATP-binding protein [Candidatus Puniceispirillaceae bacterium]
MNDKDLQPVLNRIADALERLAPLPVDESTLPKAEGYVWDADTKQCRPIDKIARLPLSVLRGISPQIEKLLENSRAFAQGKLANNALLWGARGTGKSSLIKSVHGALIEDGYDIAIVEIAREDIGDLPEVMSYLGKQDGRYILFCDDLAFEAAESSYKALKAALEGGLTGRPSNIVFYASSNRRHLMSRQMIDNERSTAINPSEAIEEKISLSDRFGLWIGFHSIDQDAYLSIIDAYILYFKIPVQLDEIRADALQWSKERGHRSGRTAFQYIIHLASEKDINLSF